MTRNHNLTGIILWAASLVAVSASCGSYATPDTDPRSQAAATATEPEHIGLQPGDLISINIWREPDLSGDFLVDERGRAVLPRLGTVDVTGRSAEEVVDTLTASFARYLKNPSIRVSVLRRVSIQGEVRNPGLYPVDATVTVSDALALAGGLTATADQNKIRLVRGGQIMDVKIDPETVVQRSPIRSGDQIVVGQKSWLARYSAVIVATLITATAIILAATL